MKATVMLSKIYYVVPRDDGWAFRIGDFYSSIYPDSLAASRAAQRFAQAQFVMDVPVQVLVARSDEPSMQRFCEERQ